MSILPIYESSGLQTLAQVLLSAFKLIWNNICTAHVLRMLLRYYTKCSPAESKQAEGVFTALQLFVALLNNIAIPCLVVAVVSPSCFYNVFVSAPEVLSRYFFKECSEANDAGQCTLYSISEDTSTFNPQFTYSYQCSSSLVTYYSPAFVIMCIGSTFVTPLGQYVLLLLHRRASAGTQWMAALEMVLPRILLPLPSDASSE